MLRGRDELSRSVAAAKSAAFTEGYPRVFLRISNAST
jgi:hypothetical protein